MATEQGSTYAAFIEDQMKAEQSRRTSLDERGSKLQQSASLAAGLFATALGLLLGEESKLAGWGLGLFVAAVVVLLLAFLCGVVATRLIAYEVADEETFGQMLNDRWGDSEATSRNITAYLNAKTIERLRPGNNFKAGALLAGITCQAIGVVLGATAFGVVASSVIH